MQAEEPQQGEQPALVQEELLVEEHGEQVASGQKAEVLEEEQAEATALVEDSPAIDMPTMAGVDAAEEEAGKIEPDGLVAAATPLEEEEPEIFAAAGGEPQQTAADSPDAPGLATVPVADFATAGAPTEAQEGGDVPSQVGGDLLPPPPVQLVGRQQSVPAGTPAPGPRPRGRSSFGGVGVMFGGVTPAPSQMACMGASGTPVVPHTTAAMPAPASAYGNQAAWAASAPGRLPGSFRAAVAAVGQQPDSAKVGGVVGAPNRQGQLSAQATPDAVGNASGGSAAVHGAEEEEGGQMQPPPSTGHGRSRMARMGGRAGAGSGGAVAAAMGGGQGGTPSVNNVQRDQQDGADDDDGVVELAGATRDNADVTTMAVKRHSGASRGGSGGVGGEGASGSPSALLMHTAVRRPQEHGGRHTSAPPPCTAVRVPVAAAAAGGGRSLGAADSGAENLLEGGKGGGEGASYVPLWDYLCEMPVINEGEEEEAGGPREGSGAEVAAASVAPSECHGAALSQPGSAKAEATR